MTNMMAVRFDCYGDVDVLDIRDVPRPSIEPGHVIVQVKAVGINPGEASIRKGLLHDRWPATFPSGQGSDFAETVIEIGEGVRSVVFGDEVLGFTNDRASQAEYVMVPAEQVTAKPAGVSWDVAGSLFVAGSTAFAAVRAIGRFARRNSGGGRRRRRRRRDRGSIGKARWSYRPRDRGQRQR